MRTVKIQRWMLLGLMLVVLGCTVEQRCELFKINCPPLPPPPTSNLNGFTTDNIKFLARIEELDICEKIPTDECDSITRQLQLLAATDSDKFSEFLQELNICHGEIPPNLIVACTEIINLRLPLSPKPCGPGSCPLHELIEEMLINPLDDFVVRDVESNEILLKGKASSTLVRDDLYTLEITKGQINSLPNGLVKLEIIGPDQNYTAIVNSIR